MRRHASDRIGYSDMAQNKPVICMGSIIARCQPDFSQRLIQHFARKIAGKGAASSICPAQAGRQTQNQDRSLYWPKEGTGPLCQSGWATRWLSIKVARRAHFRQLQGRQNQAGKMSYPQCLFPLKLGKNIIQLQKMICLAPQGIGNHIGLGAHGRYNSNPHASILYLFQQAGRNRHRRKTDRHDRYRARALAYRAPVPYPYCLLCASRR